MATVVYRYGLRARQDGPYRSQAECRCGSCPPGRTRCRGRASTALLLPPEVVAQLELVWRMRQDLVAIEHAHEEALRALWSSVPAVAAVEERLVVVEDRAAALAARAREERSRARTIATQPATAAELRDASAQARKLRVERRQAITGTAPAKRAELSAHKQDRAEAVRACRRRYAAAGLYWASYNMALSDHAVTVQLVAHRRAHGRGARLRHRRWDQTGTIAAQLQRETGISVADRERIVTLAAEGLTAGQIADRLNQEKQERRWLPRSVAAVVCGGSQGRRRRLSSGRIRAARRNLSPPARANGATCCSCGRGYLPSSSLRCLTRGAGKLRAKARLS
jgi:hypothetical protein